MAKTIDQLRALAAQIEEAYRQGENTQLRVGGLFMDIIDLISTIPAMQTVLGPLLQALNNSDLINPSDGQTLTFSLIKDGWTFSDAITQLQIKMGQISSTVASNYQAFISTKNLLQQEIDDTDQRVRGYKSDYDQSQIEYATWKSQTDTSISQYAVAIDKNTGDIISISERVDTAYDQLDFVTNNLEASDKALNNLLDLTGLQYEDPEGSYTSSWLYKNRQGIYGAAATFDDQGNILQSSVLGVTVNGVESRVSNAEGQVSLMSQTISSIQSAVAGSQSQIDTINGTINGTTGNPGILQRLGSAENTISGYAESASWIQQNRNSISMVVGQFDSSGNLRELTGYVTKQGFSGLFAEAYNATGTSQALAEINVQLHEKVDEEGVERIISEANINADDINFKFSERWSVKNSNGTEVMYLEPSGDLHLSHGVFYGDIVGATVTTGNRIKLDGGRTILELSAIGAASSIIGTIDGEEIIRLGFVGGSATFMVDDISFVGDSINIGNTISLYRTYSSSGYTAILELNNMRLSSGANGSYISAFGGLELGSGIKLVGIPTSKPSGSGYVYSDSGTLKIS